MPAQLAMAQSPLRRITSPAVRVTVGRIGPGSSTSLPRPWLHERILTVRSTLANVVFALGNAFGQGMVTSLQAA